jgi:O-succinylbenzoate synthase
VEHQGMLIRVGDGFGCVHPWEELGDPSLDALIDSLKKGDCESSLLRNALECARLDGEARCAGVSLFDGLSVPDSHATIAGEGDLIVQAIEEGYEVVKLKARSNINLEMLEEVHQRYPQLRWRFDFNQCLDEEKWHAIENGFSESFASVVDFVEDPVPYGVLKRKGRLPLALDNGVAMVGPPYSSAVIKPAVDHVPAVFGSVQKQKLRSVFTSYMDHPLGQSYAAYVAGSYRERDPLSVDTHCGLMTHGLFEPNAFTELLADAGPAWKAASGSGLGFDNQLENLNWSRVR